MNPLEELTPPTVDDVFAANPGKLKRADYERMVEHFRITRAKWRAKQTEKGKDE